ncbi:hypothetical protein MAP00_000999 [Monascus purpureus]|nr:hypothetical protein MAP00_000999 [Monascus purpureus]
MWISTNIGSANELNVLVQGYDLGGASSSAQVGETSPQVEPGTEEMLGSVVEYVTLRG